MASGSAPPFVQFGVFEVDPATGELRRQGRRVKIHDQPFRVLLALLERPGELITRQELQQRLWPDDTFVEFDNNLNNAIRRLRDALGDAADRPLYVETVPRRGYRFIAPVVVPAPRNDGHARRDTAAIDSKPDVKTPEAVTAAASATRPPGRLVAAGVLALAAVAVLLGMAALAGGYRDGSRPPGTFSGPVDAIAVLPLQNPSGDAGQEYFAEGMTEALTLELANIRPLRVISHTSSMLYKATAKRAPEIARELGVPALVEGTVRRDGNLVRVNVRLIAAATDSMVWSQSYERELGDVLALHRDIARAVATEIRLAVLPDDQQRRGVARLDPDAYITYLRGRHLRHRRTEPELRRALEYFEQVVQRAPDYAPAHAGIAAVWDAMSSWGEYVPPREGFPKARAAATRALELDNSLGEAHMRIAFVDEAYEWRLDAAEAGYKRAIELSPNEAEAYHRYGHYLSRTGRREAALEMSRRAVALDPLSQEFNIGLGGRLNDLGRPDEGLEQMIIARDIDPSYFDSWVHLSFVYQALKRPADQLAAAKKGVELSNGAPHALQALANAYTATGNRTDAELLLAELERRPEQRNPFELARLNLQFRNGDRALFWLQAACRERTSSMAFFRVSHRWQIFDAIRQDRRFQEVMRCAGINAGEPVYSGHR